MEQDVGINGNALRPYKSQKYLLQLMQLLQSLQLQHLRQTNYNTNDIKSRPTRIVPLYPAFSANVCSFGALISL